MDGDPIYSSIIYSHYGRKWLLSKHKSLSESQNDHKHVSYQSTNFGHDDSSDTAKIVAATAKLYRLKKSLADSKSSRRVSCHPYLDMLSGCINTGKDIIALQPQRTIFDIDINEYKSMLEELNASGKKFQSNSLEDFGKIIYKTSNKILYAPMLSAKQIAILISLASSLAQGQKDEREQIEALREAKSLLDSNTRVANQVMAPVINWHMADHKVSCAMCGLKFSNTKYKSLHNERSHQKVKRMAANWLALPEWIEKSSEIYLDKTYPSTPITMSSLYDLWLNNENFKWLQNTFQFSESLDDLIDTEQVAVVDTQSSSLKSSPLQLLNAWAMGDKSLVDHVFSSEKCESPSIEPCDSEVFDFSIHFCYICGDSFDIVYSEKKSAFVLKDAFPLVNMSPVHIKKNCLSNPNLVYELWKSFGLNLYNDYWSFSNAVPEDLKYVHYQCYNSASMYRLDVKAAYVNDEIYVEGIAKEDPKKRKTEIS